MLNLLGTLIKVIICIILVIVTIIMMVPYLIIDVLIGIIVTIFGGSYAFHSLGAWEAVLEHWSNGEFMF